MYSMCYPMVQHGELILTLLVTLIGNGVASSSRVNSGVTAAKTGHVLTSHFPLSNARLLSPSCSLTDILASGLLDLMSQTHFARYFLCDMALQTKLILPLQLLTARLSLCYSLGNQF